MTERLSSVVERSVGLPRTSHTEELLRAGIVVAVGVLCFGLGTLYAGSVQVHKVFLDSSQRVPYLPAVGHSNQGVVLGAQSEAPNGKQIVVSKNGKKYHYLWCKGAQSISPKNKKYFTTTDEARKAGYTPASNCPGLK